MKKHASLLLVLAAVAAMSAGAAVDPFYQGLLREGQHAFDRKDYGAAVRDLRLACFGMLEEPRQLADCLARLALAQDRLEDAEAFRVTFQRLVELEERFKAYSQGELSPGLRNLLEQRVAVRIPAATLQSSPGFSALARKPAPAPQEKRPAPGAAREGRRSTAPAKESAAPPPAAVSAARPETAPARVETSTATDLTDAERKILIRARLILSEQKPAKDELEEAFKTSRQVADAHPGLREAHHLAGEAAYRLRRWSDALQYFRQGGDPGEEQPERLFYLAVTLYESGDAAAAATAMRRALPHLQRTTYVDSYSQKILGVAVQ